MSDEGDKTERKAHDTRWLHGLGSCLQLRLMLIYWAWVGVIWLNTKTGEYREVEVWKSMPPEWERADLK